eukprot:TRINITY_DN3014_c2_g1_i1.p2 TRINITY_DN3014_c2_g1~~TRINITY_DN3014_c2_g1_i1.p2  ORF type:complete len:219 (-),score=50.51 TRINITY_DN3014_c2_g1_i1:130-786(-)
MNLTDATPISEVVKHIDITPFERYQVHVALESNLILTFGLLKRIRPEKISRLDIPNPAKLKLQQLITSATGLGLQTNELPEPQTGGHPFGEQSGEASGCPFLFKEALRQRQGQVPPPPTLPIQSNSTQTSSSEESEEESDSEDSLDEYLAQWGISLPKEKASGGSCPFIFQRMMIERRRLQEEAKNQQILKEQNQQAQQAQQQDTQKSGNRTLCAVGR